MWCIMETNAAIFESQDESVLFDLKDQHWILRITVDSYTSYTNQLVFSLIFSVINNKRS